MKQIAVTLAAIALLTVALPHAQAPTRFDYLVRTDFFAGFTGDQARLKKAMEVCERTLAENPSHAEALVWHGAGLTFQAGAAFQKGDMQAGGDLWSRGNGEMDKAVELAPENVGVLIPRGALLLQATRNLPPAMAAPLIEKAIGDYEKTLQIQTTNGTFAALGDHPKGELLFGIAEGYARLGRPEKARAYFERLTADAPGSGQTPKAREWLASGTLPASSGLGCVGCHK